MAEPKFLVSRTDRAGDLILTLPVFRELKRAFPGCHITAHARSYTAPLLRLCREVDSIVLDDDFAPGLWQSELAETFKKADFDRAIIVHPTGRAILAAWRAGIPLRTGRASNVYQLLLNDRRVQKRSRNEKHEYQYNLDLLEGIVQRIDQSPWQFALDQTLTGTGADMLAGLGMAGKKPVVVHPGHGGSAYNVTTEMYAALTGQLLKHGIPVLVSLGPGEEKLQSYFQAPERGQLGFVTSVPDLALLAGLFVHCAAFVGGSTGPLHLAAALNKPCVAFFPPVKAMTPARWGPVGCKSLVIKPDLGYCNGRCSGCNNAGCMNRLDIHHAINWLLGELRS